MNRKKRVIITIAFVLVLFLILLTTFGRLYLSLNVILGHDVLIDLRVNQDYFKTINNDKIQIEFKTSVTSNPFCSAECDYKFIDLSKDEIVDENSFSITTLIPIDKKYEITTEKGTGSKIYRFEVECSSENTFLCKTTEESRLRHISVVVEHDLNQAQEDAKNYSLESYEKFSIMQMDSKEKYFLINKNLPKIDEYYIIANKSELLAEFIEDNRILLNEFEKIWKEREYELLISEIQSKNNSFFTNIKTINTEYNKLNEQFQAHNIILNNLEQTKTVFENISSFFVYSNNSLSEINSTRTRLNETISSFEAKDTIDSKAEEVNNITNNIETLYTEAFYQHIVLKKNITESLDVFRDKLCNEISCSEEYENYTYIFNASKEVVCREIEFAINNATQHNITNIYLPEICPDFETSVSEINITEINFEDYENNESNFDIPKTLPNNPDICCLLDECQPCCYSNDCTRNPIILVHGHAIDYRTPPDYSMDAFNKLQVKLDEEGILSMGRISLYNYLDLPENIWGRFRVPMSIKVSYYYDVYTEDESNIIVPTKNENIETYAIRLREIINSILYKTNTSETIIFAHSMGGLVTRRYMQIFGTDKVEKVLLLGVPNHGVSGVIADLCPIFGENLECRDLRKDSLFLNKLNTGRIPDIPLYNVVATGCEMREGEGDGVVLRESAWLEEAENFVVEGDCESGKTFHSQFIKNVDESEFFKIVRNFLRE